MAIRGLKTHFPWDFASTYWRGLNHPRPWIKSLRSWVGILGQSFLYKHFLGHLKGFFSLLIFETLDKILTLKKKDTLSRKALGDSFSPKHLN